MSPTKAIALSLAQEWIPASLHSCASPLCAEAADMMVLYVQCRAACGAPSKDTGEVGARTFHRERHLLHVTHALGRPYAERTGDVMQRAERRSCKEQGSGVSGDRGRPTGRMCGEHISRGRNSWVMSKGGDRSGSMRWEFKVPSVQIEQAPIRNCAIPGSSLRGIALMDGACARRHLDRFGIHPVQAFAQYTGI